MMRLRRRFAMGAGLACGLGLLGLTAAAQVNPSLYAGLQWRNIGPWHGGRVAAVTGVIGQPGVFYIGTPQGGIWKTTSAGVAWSPIFDSITQVDSIGAIQVAPSNPSIIYAGSGDSVGGSDGDGMYKSTDAGKTWSHIGLEQTAKINKLVVDPTNPDLVLASTEGDATHPGSGGIYRSTDGGKTWTNVFSPAGVSGTRDLEFEFDKPNIMFATTMGTGGFRFGPPPPNAPPPTPAKLFKSTDEGLTWNEISTLPKYTGRISVAVAMHSDGARVYVVGPGIEGGSGLVRSDDGGATWRHMDPTDRRVANGQGAYSSGVWVDPGNPDIVYTVATALYRSTDGGNTFIPFKGAPGGEDYHPMWIDPTNGNRMLLGVDQGASVTLDGGHTWSTFYNLPISQVYHIATTNDYPYWILASQQDTGAVMERAFGDYGEINNQDWSPLPSSEFGTITADPLHPNIMYGVGYGPGGGGSGLIKIDMKTGQWENVAPNFGVDETKYRATRDTWKRFDPFNQHDMYIGYQCLLVTHDGAQTWQPFSPDLTTLKGKPMVACGTPEPPSAPGAALFGGRRGSGPAINDFQISAVKKGVFWTVSSNGQIFNTMDDGQHWTNVSNITDAPEGTAFNQMDLGPDPLTAYIAGRARAIPGHGAGNGTAGVDGNVPLIWRTHDGGKSWTKIVAGLPSDEPTGSWVNVVRADPTQPGLLFAGTETTVYVSFDDGNNWQSLRQNLPSTSIRDLVFHTHDHMNDMVIGTYGRGFWVMDDMSPLREIAAKAQAIESAGVYFFKPGDAIRHRVNVNWDQPTQKEEDHGPNPPYGAMLYYYLGHKPTSPITLKVYDAQGNLVRTMTSTLPPKIEDAEYPDYWLASPQSRALSAHVGTNRAHWDLQYDDPPAFNHDLENQMNMVEGMASPGPHGPQVIPGVYTLKLTVDGQTYTQSVTVNNDPRVGQSPAMMAALREQNRLTMLAYHAMQDSYQGNEDVAAARTQLASLQKGSGPADVQSAAKELDAKMAKFGGPVASGAGRRRGPVDPKALQSFQQLNNTLNTMVSMIQVGMDMAPTPTQIATWEQDCGEMNRSIAAWKTLQTTDVAAFNKLLAQNNLQPLQVTSTGLADPACTFTPTAATAPSKGKKQHKH